MLTGPIARIICLSDTTHCLQVSCFICPTHSLDNFMKNVCLRGSHVRIAGDPRVFDWDQDYFSSTIDYVWTVVKFVTNHHKPLAIYRECADCLPRKPVGGTELVKFCETRFASRILMCARYVNCIPILEKLVIDTRYTDWVMRQTSETKAKADSIKGIIRDESTLTAAKTLVEVLGPVVKLLRITDTKAGSTLGKVYASMLQLDEYFRKPIKGLDIIQDNDDLLDELGLFRPRLHAIFMARWEYFHVPIMTVAYRLEPEYCRRKFSSDEQADVRAIFLKMATPEHTVADILCDYAEYEDALSMGTDLLNEEVAFSPKAQKMASYRWAKTYLAKWPHLMYVAVRVLALSCSATGCEDSWSVEGWIHNKKRNRLGQKMVERLVRTHTNLILEGKIELFEDECGVPVLPWDLEMVPLEQEDSDSDEESAPQRHSKQRVP